MVDLEYFFSAVENAFQNAAINRAGKIGKPVPDKTAGREESAIYFTSLKRSTRPRDVENGQFGFKIHIRRLAGRNRFISFHGSEASGLAFGSPASRRCAEGAARRTRFSISNVREYFTLFFLLFADIFLIS